MEVAVYGDIGRSALMDNGEQQQQHQRKRVSTPTRRRCIDWLALSTVHIRDGEDAKVSRVSEVYEAGPFISGESMSRPLVPAGVDISRVG